MSTGHSTKAGPCTPERAAANASATAGIRSRTRRIRLRNFTFGAAIGCWSISCNAPRPCRSVGAAPPSSTTGDCAICAFLSAVTAFVTPGPAVTAATPGMPVSRAAASAAKTAAASPRVSTTRMPRALAPERIGEMCPPQSVKSSRTPWASSAAATASPPCAAGSISAFIVFPHPSAHGSRPCPRESLGIRSGIRCCAGKTTLSVATGNAR